MPVLPDSSSITSLVHCVDVSLTELPASRPNGRRAHRHARECESNTGSNHHRRLQRSRCPNDNTNKSLVKTTCSAARVTLRSTLRLVAKRPVKKASRPSVQVIERSVLRSCCVNRVRPTVRKPSRRTTAFTGKAPASKLTGALP
jgi:hypothetical protein